MTRREALIQFVQFMAASPLLADRKYSELNDPIFGVANVFDMAAQRASNVTISALGC